MRTPQNPEYFSRPLSISGQPATPDSSAREPGAQQTPRRDGWPEEATSGAISWHKATSAARAANRTFRTRGARRNCRCRKTALGSRFHPEFAHSLFCVAALDDDLAEQPWGNVTHSDPPSKTFEDSTSVLP